MISARKKTDLIKYLPWLLNGLVWVARYVLVVWLEVIPEDFESYVDITATVINAIFVGKMVKGWTKPPKDAPEVEG